VINPHDELDNYLDIYRGGGTDALQGSNPGDRFTYGPAQAGKNGLPAFRWNGFHGIGLISRSSSTLDLESQLRSMDNYPDTGGLGFACPARRPKQMREPTQTRTRQDAPALTLTFHFGRLQLKPS
jgi:hypothetical protein